MLKKTDLHNFVDDNTITAVCDQLADLIRILETEGQLSVEWFKENEMVVNSDKFQAIVIINVGLSPSKKFYYYLLQ